MEKHGQTYSRSQFSPPHVRAALRFDYDPVSGRLMVTAPQGGFVIFHGVPIDAYIWLRFSPTPETYLRERLIGEFSFVCSSACWPKA